MLILELAVILLPVVIIGFGLWAFITASNQFPEQADLPDLELDIIEHENYWREDRY